MDPGEQAARDRHLAYVQATFTDAARAAGEVPRGDDAPPATGYTHLGWDQVREVWVYAHDAWWLGELEAYRRRGDAWEGRVRWVEHDHARYVDWLPSARIKPIDSLDEGEAQDLT